MSRLEIEPMTLDSCDGRDASARLRGEANSPGSPRDG